jgi:hypothetical protein
VQDARTPLWRVGAAAAKNPALPPRVSSNAFKALPPSATTSSDCDDTEAGQAGPGSLSPTVAAQKCQRSDSAGDGSEAITNPLKKSKTTEVEPASKTTPTIPAFREGADVNLKILKASDYEDVVRALILCTASEYCQKTSKGIIITWHCDACGCYCKAHYHRSQPLQIEFCHTTIDPIR